MVTEQFYTALVFPLLLLIGQTLVALGQRKIRHGDATVQTNHLTGVQISAGQEVAAYVRSRATNYYAYCGQLTIVQTA